MPTTVTGGPSVNILGFDGLPIPAIYAQAYLPNNGRHNLLITNKSAQAQTVAIELNGHQITGPLNVTWVSNSSPVAANTANAPNTVQIERTSTSSPIQVAGYSVTNVNW